MPRGRAVTPRKAVEIDGLLASGLAVTAVARESGTSRGAVRNYIARKAQAAQAREKREHEPLPEGANESDLAIRLEMRDALLERMRGEVDVHELARLTRELNVTLDGIRRARAIPVAEEDFADEDADWVLKKLRALGGQAPSTEDEKEEPEPSDPTALAG